MCAMKRYEGALVFQEKIGAVKKIAMSFKMLVALSLCLSGLIIVYRKCLSRFKGERPAAASIVCESGDYSGAY